MAFDMKKKLEQKVREDLAQIINYETSDPRLTMVSITRVELFQQNQFGTVHYSVIGDEAVRRKVQRALEHAAGYIQNQLGRRLKTRHTPRLTFTFDPGLERAVRVSQLFNQLEQERAELEEAEAVDAPEEVEEAEPEE